MTAEVVSTLERKAVDSRSSLESCFLRAEEEEVVGLRALMS